MPDLTPAQHAQFGCDYLNELLQALQARQWCFYDTAGIERKISDHAKALGIPAPLERPSKPEHETPEELRIWLKMHDPLTEVVHERLIGRVIFAPPPAAKGTVVKTVCTPLDQHEQDEFRQFVDRLKREFIRRGFLPSVRNQQPMTTPLVDGVSAAASKDQPPRKGMATVAELASEWGVNAEAARKALDRWRNKHAGGDGFTQNPDRRPNEPQFIYERAKVYHVMEGLMQRQVRREIRRTKTSGERPARRD
jgi:hypothetical protein